MTTDRDRWLPLLSEQEQDRIETSLSFGYYKGEYPIIPGRGGYDIALTEAIATAQRDADWQVVEELVALTTEAIKHLFDTALTGVDQSRKPILSYTCMVCGGMNYVKEKVCHAAACPVGQFLALKIRMEAKV